MSKRTKAPPRHKNLETTENSPLPSMEEVLRYIENAEGRTGKKEIARHFKIKSSQKSALKKLLAQMMDDGLLVGKRNNLRPHGSLPHLTTLEITGCDPEGDLIAKPLKATHKDGSNSRILVLQTSSSKKGKTLGGTLAVGDHIMARITRVSDPKESAYSYHAEPLKKVSSDSRSMLGIYRYKAGKGTIYPVNRKELKFWAIETVDHIETQDGDLVRFDLLKAGRYGAPKARILETLGNPEEERKVSLIAVHAHGIRENFPSGILEDLNKIAFPSGSDRHDLTQIPLITIDPRDARDHDDAVYAEPDTNPNNPHGHIITVAIADVAFYVRPGSQLDREALLRGNSVYFPDRVVPMLPEKISNELCSLVEGEYRPCLAVKMIFDQYGEKLSHIFFRGNMRSVARLTYDQVQQSLDGSIDKKCAPLMGSVLHPLWKAYLTLKSARTRRGPLDLDLPERRVELNSEGKIERIYIPERLEAHRLIEEIMIQANVAAAETLEKKNQTFLYRIHDKPSAEKLKNLRHFLETQNLKIPPHGTIKSQNFNNVLSAAKFLPAPELINETVLRSQSQAEYHFENIGHFGLNLSRYVHFTSPIRRYADLLVHRALIRCLDLGEGAMVEQEVHRVGDIAKSISEAERRAMMAERETLDRLVAFHLADHIGKEFDGQISGVTRSGLFIRLKETGADGFIPMSSLHYDYFIFEPKKHALIGSRTGLTFRLGDKMTVRLVEAIPSAGALRFELVSDALPKRDLRQHKRRVRSSFPKGRMRSPRG